MSLDLETYFSYIYKIKCDSCVDDIFQFMSCFASSGGVDCERGRWFAWLYLCSCLSNTVGAPWTPLALHVIFLLQLVTHSFFLSFSFSHTITVVARDLKVPVLFSWHLVVVNPLGFAFTGDRITLSDTARLHLATRLYHSLTVRSKQLFFRQNA